MEPKDTYARRGDVQLLDVREPSEWEAGHVAGSVHIPMQQLASRLEELDEGRTVVAMCRSGGRSSVVTAWLRTRGYDVHNLEGGLKAWAAEGLELETGDGSPGTVA